MKTFCFSLSNYSWLPFIVLELAKVKQKIPLIFHCCFNGCSNNKIVVDNRVSNVRTYDTTSVSAIVEIFLNFQLSLLRKNIFKTQTWGGKWSWGNEVKIRNHGRVFFASPFSDFKI